MTRVLFALVLTLAPVAVARADDKADLKALGGKWLVTDVELEGKKVTDMFKNVELAIDGENYTVKVGTETDKGTLKVDGSKKPKAIDVVGGEGPNRGKTYPCVYELKDDTLTVCYGIDLKTRPTEFKTAAKSNTMIIVYKRKK